MPVSIDSIIKHNPATGKSLLKEWQLASEFSHIDGFSWHDLCLEKDFISSLCVIANSSLCSAFLRYFDWFIEISLMNFIDSLIIQEDSLSMLALVLDRVQNHEKLISTVYKFFSLNDEKMKEKIVIIVELKLSKEIKRDIELHLIQFLTCETDHKQSQILLFEQFLNAGFHDLLTQKLKSAALHVIKQHLATFADSPDSVINVILEWFETEISPKLFLFVKGECSTQFLNSLKSVIFDEFCRLRANSIFELVIDYPTSAASFEDIKTSVDNNYRVNIELILQVSHETFSRRLLQPGAKTDDIIHFYISCISSFMILDPKGRVAQLVTEPIRDYLRSREDTVRCIIHRIFNDEQLEKDLKLPELIKLEEDLVSEDGSNKDTDELGDYWEPSPKILPISKYHSSKDILSSLVNIYSSKDVFLNEFKNYLASRLLCIKDYNIDNELKYVEMLKIRFGDCLHSCEVMLKDISDSKRLESNMRITSDLDVHALVLSHLFWPHFKECSLNYPEKMQKIIKNFEKEFETLKRGRKLKWSSEFGSVDLELRISDNFVQEFSVPPIQAAIIQKFEKKNEWKISELAQELNLPEEILRQKLTFWISSKVLYLYEQSISLAHFGDEDEPRDDHAFYDTCEENGAITEEATDGMSVYWTFINAMLTNLGSLPLERIHMMLTMFVQSPNKFDCTKDELHVFLEKLVREDKLEYAGGSFKLK